MSTQLRCTYCGTEFRAVRRDTLFCSRACRQAAYRARKMVSAEDIIASIHRARVKSAATKRSRAIVLTCLECGAEYERSGLSVSSQYCSNACRQRMYRQRAKMLYAFLMSVVGAEKNAPRV